MELRALVHTYNNFAVIGKCSFFQVHVSIKYLRGPDIMTVLHGSTPKGRLLTTETLPCVYTCRSGVISTLSVLGVTNNLWPWMNIKMSECILYQIKRTICILFPWLLNKKNQYNFINLTANLHLPRAQVCGMERLSFLVPLLGQKLPSSLTSWLSADSLTSISQRELA